MLLKMRSLLLLIVGIISFSATAQKAEFLQAGKYSAIMSDKNLCPNFTLVNEDFNDGNVTIAKQYNFILKNSKHLVESDIDPSCQFKEINKIENKPDRTILNRINEEYCSGKLRSKTNSEVEITKQEIKLRHQIDGAEINCLWKR